MALSRFEASGIIIMSEEVEVSGYSDGYVAGYEAGAPEMRAGKYVAVHEEQFDAGPREIDLLDVDGIYATECDGCDW